ncbi:hypothetical protein AB0D84_29310 [Streptomyces sp. NPDC048193]|uniref:hypothetical protein n=1 Tax=unclassified Streptomyces TaxID=2593676 RepID=UPI003418ABB1
MTDRDVLVFPEERDRVDSLPADHPSGLLLHVAVDAHLDHPVARPGGPSVLRERRVGYVGPARAMRFLGPAVEELRDPEDPFGPLITRENR